MLSFPSCLSIAEKVYVLDGLKQGYRSDGRSYTNKRAYTVVKSVVESAMASARVISGCDNRPESDVTAAVKCSIIKASDINKADSSSSSGSHGLVSSSIDVSGPALASLLTNKKDGGLSFVSFYNYNFFLDAGIDEWTKNLVSFLDNTVLASAVDEKKLTILKDQLYWRIHVHVQITVRLTWNK
jgi:hypothetical protein